MTDAKEIPGVVAIAATGKETIYQGAFGKRDLSEGRAMTPDSVFWIASMTKAITAAAGMQLVEQGKLSLDEPIGKVLPDSLRRKCWKASTPRASRSAAGEEPDHPAPSADPYRGLRLQHVERRYGALSGEDGTPDVTTCKNAALKTPLMTDPGTRWEYGTNIDFVGQAVEAASGKRLDAYCATICSARSA